ncbi:hypothetical protein C6A85_09010 [Mycobacterium sp. ITM-2017-0098]|nr:hypothetical protein C6A85_09010 [Mycobacterium sp. ITM-2017-0098]
MEGFVQRYLDTVADGSADDVAALYAEDATLEDPVGGGMRIEPIEVMSFNGDGQITSMKAYWGPQNITQL